MSKSKYIRPGDFTPAHIKGLLKLIANGRSQDYCARLVGCSRNTIRCVLEAQPEHRGKRAIGGNGFSAHTNDLAAVAQQLHRDGHDMPRIASMMDRTVTSVRNYLQVEL